MIKHTEVKVKGIHGYLKVVFSTDDQLVVELPCDSGLKVVNLIDVEETRNETDDLVKNKRTYLRRH